MLSAAALIQIAKSFPGDVITDIWDNCRYFDFHFRIVVGYYFVELQVFAPELNLLRSQLFVWTQSKQPDEVDRPKHWL